MAAGGDSQIATSGITISGQLLEVAAAVRHAVQHDRELRRGNSIRAEILTVASDNILRIPR